MLVSLSRDRLANSAMFLTWLIKERQFLALTPGIFSKKSCGPGLYFSDSGRVSESAVMAMAVAASGCGLFCFSSSNSSAVA